jgi:hypothetical protein
MQKWANEAPEELNAIMESPPEGITNQSVM